MRNGKNQNYFDSLLFYFLAQENEVNLDSYFGFVQDGEKKIFEQLDYSKLSDPLATGASTVANSNRSFQELLMSSLLRADVF